VLLLLGGVEGVRHRRNLKRIPIRIYVNGSIVDTAAEVGAQALVLECMAVQPLLQSLSELRLVRAAHGVVTNVRGWWRCLRRT
jgi:hypothetical protein